MLGSKLGYILKRIFSTIPTLLILMGLTFFLLRLAPGGPFDADRVWPAEIQANLMREYGLDLPLSQQFTRWAAGVFRGNLQESFQYTGRPVTEIIGTSLPVSMLLGSWALSFALLVGIVLGCLSAWRPRSWLDRGITFFVVSSLSVPSFLLAAFFILIFSLWLKWLPPALWEDPESMILPSLTLGWRPMAIVARFVRTSMDEILASDFIRTARGKGLSEAQVILKHALKNSLIPVMTIIGPIAANLVTGSFIVEVIFQIPGIGKHFVQAVLNRDYPLVMGITLVYGVILILCNLTIDLLYTALDPRIQIDGQKA